MSYAPLGEGRTSPNAEVIELTTKNDGRSPYAYAPPPGEDLKDGDLKTSFPFGSATIDNWPAKSQQIAALTPLRGWILAFDILLASSPLLFIGTFDWTE
jgi:hypothetical protein